LPKAAEPAARRHGFTLLEAVVAFAIASLALIALFRATSDGIGGVEAASNSIEATRRAQSILVAVGITEKLTPGEQSGTFDNGFDWRVVVTLQDERPVPPPAGSTPNAQPQSGQPQAGQPQPGQPQTAQPQPALSPAGPLHAAPSEVALYSVVGTVGWTRGRAHHTVALTGYRLVTQSANSG
jgi:type II secretory pathway pseudopilin PulG